MPPFGIRAHLISRVESLRLATFSVPLKAPDLSHGESWTMSFTGFEPSAAFTNDLTGL